MCESTISIQSSGLTQLIFFTYNNNMQKLSLIILLTIVILSASQLKTTSLNEGWTMKILSGPGQSQAFKSKSYPTSVPTTVHLDLLAAGDIPDPFLNSNYPKVDWVSKITAKYSTNFTIDNPLFEKQIQNLVFQGIDTYSEIILNGQKILTTENAFRMYNTDVKKFLLKGINTLQVTIKSTTDYDTLGQTQNNMPFVYAHTRKACYQYSWDWAPYLNTLGIWKNVYLESFDQIKLENVWIRNRLISQEKAVLNFALTFEYQNTLPKGYSVKIYQFDKQITSRSISDKHIYLDLTVQKPKLWWPNGIGAPYIYDYKVTLIKNQGNVVIHEKIVPYGIRHVELDLSNKGFTVKINGYSIYSKGANYVPPDMFYPRLTNKRYNPGNTIETLLNDAVDSNFNMIRVWGGGQYQSDQFLQLASRKGIMLFYDFMFSDSIYPSTQNFLLNVEEQIKQQIRRARNYPALTLWSGNNQILQGINDWGWNQERYRKDYERLFSILIKKVIQFQSPYIPYIPSSPIYGVGNYGIQRGGDTHYWSVWAAGAQFQSYIHNVGRFNSQFGTQALPVWQTVLNVMSNNPSYEDKDLLLHQRHGSQFNTLKQYMSSYMKPSLNFQLQTYQSGLLQAFAIQLAIKAQRAAKPMSGGTLYWQMNDAWPAISWSSIDYFGRWKPLQFMAKRLYPDVAMFTSENKIYAVNDKLYPVEALGVIELYSLDGKSLKKIEKTVSLKANEVQIVHEITEDNYGGVKKEDCMIYTQIVAGKNQEMSSTTFMTRFKTLNLRPVTINVQFNAQFNVITLEAEGGIAKNVYISHNKKYIKVSNNYFDLIPGRPVKTIVLNPEGLKELQGQIKIRSYIDVYDAGNPTKVNIK